MCEIPWNLLLAKTVIVLQVGDSGYHSVVGDFLKRKVSLCSESYLNCVGSVYPVFSSYESFSVYAHNISTECTG